MYNTHIEPETLPTWMRYMAIVKTPIPCPCSNMSAGVTGG